MKAQVKQKLVAIGDIHGLTVWKDIVDENRDADKIIFVGDYFDSFDVPPTKQLENFNNIVSFAQNNPDQVVLLMGNHDYHYFGTPGETYPGYSPSYSFLYKDALSRVWDRMQYLYVAGDTVFSHAGFTTAFLKKIKWRKKFNEQGTLLNAYLKENPSLLKFEPTDFSRCGKSVYQSCIWVRPNELVSDPVTDFSQVVGHTKNKTIFIQELPKGNKIAFIDCLEYKRSYWTTEGIKTVRDDSILPKHF